MSGDYPPDADPLVRPFLDRGPARSPEPLPPTGDLRGEVRPYLITGGRTAAHRVDVAMETVVVAGVPAADRPERLAFERAAILAECVQPRSVAEVAARLRVPLVVAVVIVADLLAEGLLEASTTTPQQADDIAFLERLIDGVTAL